MDSKFNQTDIYVQEFIYQKVLGLEKKTLSKKILN